MCAMMLLALLVPYMILTAYFGSINSVFKDTHNLEVNYIDWRHHIIER